MGVIPESGSGARPGWGRGSGPAQHQALYGVVAALVHDQVGTAAGGGDVLDEVALVDVAPDVDGELRRLVVGHVGDVLEVGLGVFEGGAAELVEAVDVPGADVFHLGVDVDGEVEVVVDGE